MLEKFLSYIKYNNIIGSGEKTLLAVSGGVDSMVMAELFRMAELPSAIAHINHLTRGEENTKEAELVKTYARQNAVKFHYKELDSLAHSKENFQAAARESRYRWLESVRLEYGYDKIATAHHEDDVIEGFFLNVFRGAGPYGLSGIKSQRGKVIRPILFAKKEEILDFARENDIRYIEDSSNLKSYYRRNFLRNEVFPLMSSKIPNFKSGVTTTIENISRTRLLLESFIEKAFPDLVQIQGGKLVISYHALCEYHPASSLLFYLVSDYGFHHDQCQQMIDSIKNTGAQFYSDSHVAWIDRSSICIMPKQEDFEFIFIIETCGKYQLPDSSFIEVEIIHDYAPTRDSSIVHFAEDPFPLSIRKWTDGDYFRPLQLKGKGKKLKKFLTDLKISGPPREHQLVVLDNKGEIVFLPGLTVCHSKIPIEKAAVSLHFQYFNV